MKFNPKPFNRRLTLYLARQEKKIEELINTSVNGIVRRTTQVNAPSDRDFFFRDYPALSKTVDNTLRRLSHDLTDMIMSGAEWSWDLANRKNDDMVSRLLKSIGASRVPADSLARWNQKNLPALQAFEQRRIGGMGLSDKVWAYTKGIKGDLELALDLGIGEGMGAGRLARSVRQYLNEPDRLYRRVRDEKGILRLSKSASNYHPGQGVYRSSYKNAKRLALNETNMAYRTADHERVQQIDFILGIEVHLSKNHTCLDSKGVPQPFHDICDELQGPYPKWFVFKGWHPNCRCYVTTILPDQKDFIKYLAAMDKEGNSTYQLTGAITNLPPGYTEWVENNAERIQQAEERGTLPYFLRDNRSTWEDIVNKPDLDADIAKALESELGVKKGKPMSYEDADTKHENPNWQRGVNNGYNHNCQTCTVTHEIRRRGFDVEAKPNNNGEVWTYFKKEGINFWHRYENEDGSRVKWSWAHKWAYDKGYKGLSQQRVLAFLHETAAKVGRYEITCDWRGRNAGHVWLMERKADGTLLFFDPQTSESGGRLIGRYIKAAELKSFAVLRVDDKVIKPAMAKLFKAAK